MHDTRCLGLIGFCSSRDLVPLDTTSTSAHNGYIFLHAVCSNAWTVSHSDILRPLVNETSESAMAWVAAYLRGTSEILLISHIVKSRG